MMRMTAAWCVLLLGACCSGLLEPTALERRPADFSLAVSVHVPPGASPAPRPFRAARYVVEPDGVLRAALGPGSDWRVFPPPTRRLTAAEMDRLWRWTRDSGLLEPDCPYRTSRPVTGAVEVPTAAVEVAYLGARASLVVPLDGADAPSEVCRGLVDSLAELAWIPP